MGEGFAFFRWHHLTYAGKASKQCSYRHCRDYWKWMQDTMDLRGRK